MSVDLKALIGKLNDVSRNALDAAANLCQSQTNSAVEVEHYLSRLLEHTDSDCAKIFFHYGFDTSKLTADLNRAVDRMKRGSYSRPVLGQRIFKMLSDAWTIGSVNYSSNKIRSGHTLLALYDNDDTLQLIEGISREFSKIKRENLSKELAEICAGSAEDTTVPEAAPDAPAGKGKRKAGTGKTPNLDQYTVNLTDKARQGLMDPVLGRDTEIRQVVDILMRRRQNNPILTGEAGVGKTAVVEGFAQRVAQGDVPPPLRKVEVHTLDLALLQAGAGIKGEFENRLKGLIEEVKGSPIPIILFIDEAHTMIGAGGQAGQGDAANLLKPALARGELRTIAATTWAEYKKYFEKDAALARRFQVVKVEEPEERVCQIMLRGLVNALEKHHNVRILDEGVNAAVRFSHRYIAGRQLPDKAVSVLDTACARVALGQNAVPAALESATRELDDLNTQERVLNREKAVGIDHEERLTEIATRRVSVEERLKTLQERFDKEKKIVMSIRGIRLRLEDPNAKLPEDVPEPTTATPDGMREELKLLDAELASLQGETPLMQVAVDSTVVGEVISGWTGIPVGNMLRDEVQTILELEKHLGARVIGQDHALEGISQRIRTSRARLEDPNKPIGVFLLVGPSGVGKTETALTLSALLYGGEHNVISINMSEFQEAHTVSTLKGSPPGYVGYGEGGVLTEAVRRRPYSVVLLDEVEKAHPDVLELFFQVFDKGKMEDGEGREIDFKNTIIILTSNAATDTLMKLVADPETAPTPAGLVKAMKPELDKVFKPAFLGRLVIIPYYPIRDEAMKSIIRLKIGKIQKRMVENHKIELKYSPELVDEVGRRCTEVESGARNVDNILTNTMLPDISRTLLANMAEGVKVNTISIGLGEDGKFTYS